jgi:hypothetical protein
VIAAALKSFFGNWPDWQFPISASGIARAGFNSAIA